MASFKTPSQILSDYLNTLKSIKPSINTNDSNSDFVIRGRVLSGLLSGLYGDQQKVDNDTFVSSARPEVLDLIGADYGMSRQQATKATSPKIRIYGTNGTTVNPGDLTFLYVPSSTLYINTTGGTISGGQLDLAVECQAPGQGGNIAAPDVFSVVSPPSGVNTSADIVDSVGDGSDIESVDSFRKRLLDRKQLPPSGGNVTDYPNFAFAASPTVRSALIKRFGRGLGTVDVYITTGTSDIDTAVTQGQAISRIPTQTTIDDVQAYYDAHVPLTDCARVYGPTEILIPVSVKILLAQGLTLSSIPSSPVYNPLGLTCQELIEREIGRVLYKLPIGGRVLPSGTQGYVMASDIEYGLDQWLSAVSDITTGTFLGKIPILANRQVLPLNGLDYDFPIAQNQLAAPGAITITLGV